MSSQAEWVGRQVRLGRALIGAGAALAVFGVVLPVVAGDLPFNERIITGLGLFVFGLGVARLVQYASARRDPQAARRLAAENRDERTRLLRGRAGQRAYFCSAALAYAALMWVSFASNGSLPALSADAVWWVLAGVVVVPMLVYIASLVFDERRS
jgi:ABC-type uncharacterized transport system permease subunit